MRATLNCSICVAAGGRPHDRICSTSKTVMIDRQALINILMDHARMLDALRKSGRVDISEDG